MPIDDYNSSTGTSGRLNTGSSVTGNIETTNDTDWFQVSLTAGTTYIIDLEGSPTNAGTLSDTYLRGIYNSSGSLISGTTNDDGDTSTSWNSQLEFTPNSNGSYYISAGAFSNGTGTYTLSIDNGTVLDGLKEHSFSDYIDDGLEVLGHLGVLVGEAINPLDDNSNITSDIMTTFMYYNGVDNNTLNINLFPNINNNLINNLNDEMEKSIKILLEKWVSEDTPYVSASTVDERIEWGDTQEYNLTLEDELYFLGDGSLFSYLESDGNEAEINFYIRDRFENPLSIGVELGGTPYDLNWDYTYPETFTFNEAINYVDGEDSLCNCGLSISMVTELANGANIDHTLFIS